MYREATHNAQPSTPMGATTASRQCTLVRPQVSYHHLDCFNEDTISLYNATPSTYNSTRFLVTRALLHTMQFQVVQVVADTIKHAYTGRHSHNAHPFTQMKHHRRPIHTISHHILHCCGGFSENLWTFVFYRFLLSTIILHWPR